MNMEFLRGLIMGFAIVLGISLIIWLAIRSKNNEPCQFDERQLMIRGKAFKIGFFTAITYNFAYGMSIVVLEKTYIDQTTAFILGTFVSICAFAVYCIWNDAYIALNRNPKRFILLFAVLGAINILAGIHGILTGEVYHDGMLDYRSTNLFVGIIFIILFITYILKRVMKKEEE